MISLIDFNACLHRVERRRLRPAPRAMRHALLYGGLREGEAPARQQRPSVDPARPPGRRRFPVHTGDDVYGHGGGLVGPHGGARHAPRRHRAVVGCVVETLPSTQDP